MFLLCLDSWAGRTETEITILKETPKRYKVRLEADCLKGKKGAVLYVPKYAVKEKI